MSRSASAANDARADAQARAENALIEVGLGDKRGQWPSGAVRRAEAARRAGPRAGQPSARARLRRAARRARCADAHFDAAAAGAGLARPGLYRDPGHA